MLKKLLVIGSVLLGMQASAQVCTEDGSWLSITNTFNNTVNWQQFPDYHLPAQYDVIYEGFSQMNTPQGWTNTTAPWLNKGWTAVEGHYDWNSSYRNNNLLVQQRAQQIYQSFILKQYEQNADGSYYEVDPSDHFTFFDVRMPWTSTNDGTWE